MKTLTEILYEVVQGNGKPPKAIAEELGISYNYLRRSVLDGPSGCNFPLRLLIPLMKATKNYKPLKHLANACGYLLVKMPTGWKRRKDPYLTIQNYQKHFTEVVKALIDFFDKPSYHNGQRVIAVLLNHMEETAAWQWRCKKNVNQMELDFDSVDRGCQIKC